MIFLLSSKRHKMFYCCLQAPLFRNILISLFALVFISSWSLLMLLLIVLSLSSFLHYIIFPSYNLSSSLDNCQREPFPWITVPSCGHSILIPPSPQHCHVPFFFFPSPCFDHQTHFICHLRIYYRSEILFALFSATRPLHRIQKLISPPGQLCCIETCSTFAPFIFQCVPGALKVKWFIARCYHSSHGSIHSYTTV